VGEDLPGGIANAGRVTREGEFVLRPSNPHSATIHAFLTGLRATGFEGASSPVAIQPDGRERLHYIAGDVAIPPFPDWAQADAALESVTLLLRDFHRASALVELGPSAWSDEMADPDGGPIICHNDVCLENVVFRDGVAVALLDFDFAAPGRPLYDLTQFARMCVPINDDESARRLGWRDADRPRRLRLVADTYGLDSQGRRELLALVDDSIERAGTFVRRRVEAGDENFIRMLADMGGMERYERQKRWWKASRPAFAAAFAR
jgi:hypothetical protein